MADRTVRAIFEARVSGAQKGMRDLSQDVDKTGKKVDGLTKDLKELDGLKAEPDIDVQIDDAQRRLSDVKLELADLQKMEATPEVTAKIEDAKARMKEIRAEIKDLQGQKAEVKIEAAIKQAQDDVARFTRELGELRGMEASPEVDVKISEAQRHLRTAKTALRELQGAKAQMTVSADVSAAEDEISGLGGEGEAAGEEAGAGVTSGIISALGTIPIAGAVVGVGAAIAAGLMLGIKQGLQIQLDQDMFSARTGLDEQTAARFGRAAGNAYGSAWGESVADNMETARVAMEQGLIDADAIDADIERVIASLTGISTIMQTDIPGAARAAGQLIKTGLADTAEDAFDVIVAGYQNGADASDDFLDTLTEYSVFFQQLGIDGQTATGLIVQGLEDGAVSGDKVADALKELVLSFQNAEEPAVKFAESIGLSMESIQSAFAEGGPAAREALDAIFEGLAQIEDPGERAAAVMALTKAAGEDLGGAFQNLNLSTAAGEIEGFAGASERALKTMSDNASTQIESARRSIEVAADGIKGALAAAFSDEIEGAAEWVARNREPLMEFFASVINGAFEMAKAFVEFSATSLESIADFVESLAQMQDIIEILVPASRLFFDDLGSGVEGMREAAQGMRDGTLGALDDMQDGFNEWVGPEIMAARVHDAATAMAADMDEFSAKVDASGGTVTIDGDSMSADDALDYLVANINESDGTVTINGDRVPAEDALDTIMALVESSEEDITIGGDIDQANRDLARARAAVKAAEDDIKINGDSKKARDKLSDLRAQVRAAEDAVKVTADTSSAARSLDSFIHRGRTIYVGVQYVARGGMPVPHHDGGWIERGLYDGGWVPGSDPGYDNVLWPLNSGGRTLGQPLTGGEFVVNSTDSRYWGPLLEWMNSGGRPAASMSAPSGPLKITGTLDLGDGVMGRLVGMARVVEQFELRAPGILDQAGI